MTRGQKLSLLTDLRKDCNIKSPDLEEDLAKIDSELQSLKEGEESLKKAPKEIVKKSVKLSPR